jgi:hypothetical protein
MTILCANFSLLTTEELHNIGSVHRVRGVSIHKFYLFEAARIEL